MSGKQYEYHYRRTGPDSGEAIIENRLGIETYRVWIDSDGEVNAEPKYGGDPPPMDEGAYLWISEQILRGREGKR